RVTIVRPPILFFIFPFTPLFRSDFIPLVRERYFFALPVAALDDPLIQQVIGILQSASFREVVKGLAGYDASDTGKILSLADAFGDRKSTRLNFIIGSMWYAGFGW